MSFCYHEVMTLNPWLFYFSFLKLWYVICIYVSCPWSFIFHLFLINTNAAYCVVTKIKSMHQVYYLGNNKKYKRIINIDVYFACQALFQSLMYWLLSVRRHLLALFKFIQSTIFVYSWRVCLFLKQH